MRACVVKSGALQHLHAKVFKRNASSFGRHWHERMTRHARAGVDLQQIGFPSFCINHHICACPAATADSCKGTQYKALDRFFLLRRQSTGHMVFHDVGVVFILKIVITVRRNNSNERQGTRLAIHFKNGASDLVAFNPCFAQGLTIQLGGGGKSGSALLIGRHSGESKARPF